jgi:hypothetical protein
MSRRTMPGVPMRVRDETPNSLKNGPDRLLPEALVSIYPDTHALFRRYVRVKKIGAVFLCIRDGSLGSAPDHHHQ